MTIFLFLFWLAAFLFFLYRKTKKGTLQLGFRFASIAFVARLFMGIFYAIAYKHLSKHSDTWDFFKLSLEETPILKRHPYQFLYTGILDGNGHTENILLTFFNPANSYFTDIHDEIVVKMMAVCNVLSFNNYYTNLIFFNVFVFVGSYYLYLFFLSLFPSSKKAIQIVIFFYIPLLFWTAGFHRDGLLFFLLSVFLYNYYKLYARTNNTSVFKHIFFAIFCWLGILFLRNFWALFLLPFSLIAYFARHTKAENYNKNIRTNFAIILIGICCFFATSLLPKSMNLPDKLAQKQVLFFETSGTYHMGTHAFDGSIHSFLHCLPTALLNTFIRPYIWEWRGPINLMALFGQLCLWASVLLLFLYPKSKSRVHFGHPIVLFLLFVCVCNYFLIGLIVPYLSAIIRYKATFEAILILLIITQINWGKSNNRYIKIIYNILKK